MLGTYIGNVFAGVAHLSAKIRPSGQEIQRPVWLSLPNLEAFNFIFWHYMYIVIMAFLGSAILSGQQNLPYIDSLFFAAGGSTQSGLNTVDVNLLTTYQQVTLVIIAMLCNPIVINMFVVFVRLYWFEKRFQHIIQSANEFRKHRTRSRSKSMDARDLESAVEPGSVAGRQITILHTPPDETKEKDTGAVEQKKSESDGSSTTTDVDIGGEKDRIAVNENNPPYKRDIMFADELPDPKGLERLPNLRPPEQHIAFVENQRRPKDNGVLRIPGPRDFDRGEVPERIESDHPDDQLSKRVSRDSKDISAFNAGQKTSELNQDDHPLKPEYSDEQPPSKADKIRAYLPFLRKKDTEDETTGTQALTFRERALTGGRSFARFLSQERGADDYDPNPYLSYSPTVGRNSVFVNLTEEQREELGGIEYRALKTLAYILMIYFWGWSIFSIITFLPWIMYSPDAKAVVDADGQGVPWWGLFTPMSHFTDLGFTLTPDSMISFQTSVLPLLVGSFLIIIGNTGFPIMLRFMIYLMSLFVPRGSGVWEELRFLLDHPRRCFTLLFPRRATWWLFGVLVVLNGIDLIFFVILDLNDPTVTSLPAGFQFLAGLYQAASTRTAGFACVNLADLHPGIQVSYLIMMYISVFPIAISVRQTNVYEENSLGIYAGAEEDNGDPEDPNTTRRSYVGTHLRRQLSFDLWFVFLGLFFVTIIEGDRIANANEAAFTIFSCLFEIVSAYGTVGLSLGYPGINASFSAEFHTLSKLIIIAMMVRGRHRGLPYALDRAILLPSENLQKKEAEMDERRRERRASMVSLQHRPSMGREANSTFEKPDRAATTGMMHTGVAIGPRSASKAPTALDDDQPVFKPVFGASTNSTGAAGRTSTRRSAFSRVISGALSAGPTHKKHHAA